MHRTTTLHAARMPAPGDRSRIGQSVRVSAAISAARNALIAVAMLCTGSAAFAQPVAKQGPVDQPRLSESEFKSPMILETDFAAGDRANWPVGKPAWFTLKEWWELGKYSCDGVFFRGDRDRHTGWDPSIQMRLRDLPPGNVEVQIEVAVQNPKNNHDKIVSMKLEAVNGEDVIKSEIVQLKAPDNGEGQQAQVKWTMPAASLLPTTKMRITMTTKDY